MRVGEIIIFLSFFLLIFLGRKPTISFNSIKRNIHKNCGRSAIDLQATSPAWHPIVDRLQRDIHIRVWKAHIIYIY